MKVSQAKKMFQSFMAALEEAETAHGVTDVMFVEDTAEVNGEQTFTLLFFDQDDGLTRHSIMIDEGCEEAVSVSSSISDRIHINNRSEQAGCRLKLVK